MTSDCLSHQVRAGRTVYLLEERTEIVGDGADGPVVRALIALDADEASDPFEEDRWRLAYAATLGTALWGPGTAPAHGADAPLGAPRAGGGGGGSGSPGHSSLLAPYSTTYSHGSPVELPPRSSPVGWVTIATNGKLLVTPQRQLDAGARQRHMVAWARRKAVDKTMASWGQGQESKKRGDDTGGAKQAKVQLPSRWKLGVFWSEVGSPLSTLDYTIALPLEARSLLVRGRISLEYP